MDVNATDVQKKISSLRNGKACGINGLTAEHLKYAGPRLHVLLNSCFSLMLHGTWSSPSPMLTNTVMVPVVKSTNGSLYDKNNYRTTALACVISKMFDGLLLDRSQHYLSTTDARFGYKHGHSTDMAVLL